MLCGYDVGVKYWGSVNSVLRIVHLDHRFLPEIGMALVTFVKKGGNILKLAM